MSAFGRQGVAERNINRTAHRSERLIYSDLRGYAAERK